MLLLVLAGCAASLDVVTEWSGGNCSGKLECVAVEYGCGGGHIACTSQPEKWKDLRSTCEIVEGHPQQLGYACGCVDNKCVWYKSE